MKEKANLLQKKSQAFILSLNVGLYARGLMGVNA